MTAPALSKLEVFHFRHALPEPLVTVMGPLAHRPALLVRIEDAEGAHGWGEIWCNFPPGGDLYRAQLAINVLPAALGGLSADTPDPFDTILTRLHRLALQAGEPGPVAQLASGADIAIHDLRARRAGRPLAELLGGSAQPVEAYASGISPEACADQVARMRGLGYRRFKQRIGFGPDDGLESAEATAADLRAGEALMLDANQAWDLDTARRRCDRLAAVAPVWLEEPLPADAPPDHWKDLARATDIPLAAGENLRGAQAFDAAISGGALRYLQPDICKWGGLSATARIARDAVARGMVYCPHFLGGGVGLVASAHLLAAVGGGGFLEVDSSENPLLSVFSGRGLALEEGRFPLLNAPGLGFDPDTAAVADLLTSHREARL
ncbi:mandelate racemase/muconate lactonizing enzyme family protein [Sulfitobacter sp. D35]|uniref:mandelate racemase/muconate lactonizing enzyme family protein n=1 Tax=Sulfitobacter sp. D35 TaxID=3083252 RepID=UPI00296E90B0|nr:mandelate racemase/muconate lactonizing enzyme family protein [Sulfitobacter sp. D35]MDW4497212.1 mandelate racemase/muconate lactonizing enzyme family protein [Sulfitobacter sp. D35]